jgi:hypothetical protein
LHPGANVARTSAHRVLDPVLSQEVAASAGFQPPARRSRGRPKVARDRGLLGNGLRRRCGLRRSRRSRSVSGRRRRGLGSRSRGRLGLRGLGRPRRQEAERVEIAVRVRREANAEMDVRRRGSRLPARPNRPDDRAFRDPSPAGYADRPQLDERDRVPLRRLDRHALATRRHRSGKADRPTRGGKDRPSQGRSDVDAAVLRAGVGVVAELEGS